MYLTVSVCLHRRNASAEKISFCYFAQSNAAQALAAQMVPDTPVTIRYTDNYWICFKHCVGLTIPVINNKKDVG